MTHYQRLSSEKYYYDTVLEEVKGIRRQKNRDALRAFAQFLFALGMIFFTLFAIEQMPNWMPTVTAYMDQYGVTEALQKWIG